MPTPSEARAASTPTGTGGGTDEALARSVLYAAVASGLRRPDADALERLATPAGRRALVLAAEAVRDAGCALASSVADLAAVAVPVAELLARYDALFGHTARGPVCAFETEYGADDPFRQPQELAHIAGYYHAFGLRPRRKGERVDHIACECEFMALLAGREACLRERARPAPEASDERAEQLELTRRAARDFLRGHLGRFGLAFAARLGRADAGGFFAILAEVLAGLLRSDASRFDAPLGPPTLDVRPPAVDPAPMACGTCPELLAAAERQREP